VVLLAAGVQPQPTLMMGQGVMTPPPMMHPQQLRQYLIHQLLRQRRPVMNWDQVAGNWKQFKGTVREKWGKLTDDDLDVVAGKRDQLLGKIQERYGITKEEAEKEFKQHWK
jgi:uncharacterized protein YjbJ (UPF0337 family)